MESSTQIQKGLSRFSEGRIFSGLELPARTPELPDPGSFRGNLRFGTSTKTRKYLAEKTITARELQAEQTEEVEREQMAEHALGMAESLGCAHRRRRAWECTQAAEQHRQMLEGRAARRLRAHGGGLNMPGSPSFDEGANNDEAGPNAPPPLAYFRVLF